MTARKNGLPAGDPNSWWWDYSDCKFAWLWNRLPRPERVRYMVEERAFHSLGKDEDLIAKVWTQSLHGGGGTEAFFAHDSGDICCADTVGFVAYQTGAVDFLGTWGGVHAVDPYFPTPDRVAKGICRLVGRYTAETFKKGAVVPQDDFLPGDYFIYCRVMKDGGSAWTESPKQRIDRWLAGDTKIEGVGNHINMYLGDFVEVGPDGKPVTDGGGTFQMINGSLGKGASGTYVAPLSLTGTFSWELWGRGAAPSGTEIVHCRFLPIERLFQDALGPPFRQRAHKNTSGGPPAPAPPVDPAADLAAFWKNVAQSKAPTPVGGNLAWHQGVHVTIPDTQPETEDPEEVVALAPGQVIAARAVGRRDEGDTGFVLVRHLFDRVRMDVVDPKTVDASKPLPDHIVPFFSAYVHLAPIDAAVFSADKGAEHVPPFAWLEAVRPLAVPKDIVPATTPVVLLAPKDGDAAEGYEEVAPWPSSVGGDIDLTPLETVQVAGADYYVLPVGSGNHRDVWTRRPTPKVATGRLYLLNPKNNTVISTTQTLGNDVLLHIDVDPSNPDTRALSVTTVNGTDYARIDAYARPGVAKQDPHGELRTVADPDDDTREILVLPQKLGKVTIHLDTATTGPAVKLLDAHVDVPLAAVADVKAEAQRLKDDPDDTDHHTLLRVLPSDPSADGDAGAASAADILWLDLIPCVALPPKKKAELDGQITGKDNRLARPADARLAAGTSTLMVALVSGDDDAQWTVDEHGSTLIAGTSPSLYGHVSLRGKQLVVETKQPSRPSASSDIHQVDGVSAQSLHALDIVDSGMGKKAARYALVEVRHAVRKKDQTDKLQDRVNAINQVNQHRQDVAKALGAGQIVDLRQAFATPPAALFVERAPVGYAGHILGEPGGAPGAHGIHLEVFAGSPLGPVAVDVSSLPEKKLTRVASSPWLVFKDTSKDDLVDATVAETLVSELTAQSPPLPGLQLAPLKNRGAAPQPWKRDEWLQFYDMNDRVLSRVLSVHESEWSLDWVKAVGAASSKQAAQTGEVVSALTDAYKALSWKGDDGSALVKFLSEDKVGDPSAFVFVYHHPARLIEYLRTRLEVQLVALDPKATTSAKVVFDTGSEKIPIQHGSSGRYPMAPAVSEAPAGDAAPPTLVGTVEITFAGANPITLKNVEVDRGTSSTLAVVLPYATLSTYWPHVRHFATGASFREDGFPGGNTLYFLADGGKHLQREGFTRAHATVTALYNDSAPKIIVSGGGGGFSATPKDPPPQVSSAAPARRRPTSKSTSSASLELDVSAATTQIGASATVTITVDGGDFAAVGVKQTMTLELRTRTIQPPSKDSPKGTIGPDVGQLQLYLAEILAADRLPCLRGDDTASNEPSVDGQYGEGLRKALWRFLYSYGKVSVTLGAGGPVSADDLAKLGPTADAHKYLLNATLLDHLPKDPAPPPEVVTAAARLRGTGGDWPVVDAAIIQRVVQVFEAGATLPWADFNLRGVLMVPMPGGVPPIPDRRVSRGLAWPQYRVFGSLKVEAEGAKLDEDVTVTVQGTRPAYGVRQGGGDPTQSFTVKMADVASTTGALFELVTVAGDGAAKLAATVPHAGTKDTWLVSQRELLPPRSFLQPYGAEDTGQDVAVMQAALLHAPRGPNKKSDRSVGYVPPVAKKKGATQTPADPAPDGVWSAGWLSALKEYAGEWGLSKSGSSALVSALLDHVCLGKVPGGT